MKKFLISLLMVCALAFGAFADEVADAEVEAQNEAIAAEQEAAQNDEAAEDAAAEENAEGETVAEEAPAEEAAEVAEPTENTEEPVVAEGDNGEEEAEPAANGEDIAAAEDTPAEEPEAAAEETEPTAEEAVAETVTETAAEETTEPEPIVVQEDNPEEPYDNAGEEEQTETAETSLPDMGDVTAAAEDIADTAIETAAGVAEEELNALIASFPKGVWIDEKYNAAWVFDENGTLTVQNAKTGKVYFTFSLNKINSYSVVPTADGIAVSFVCGETKRQYTFTKSNENDYNMTLQIQAKWLKGGYTTTMTKKQDINVGKN
ncbi:MAG: hypothetical protein IKQ61_02945 [Spirochaetales bacterium]|nr:hypothetical protein [Spirochaetales bacterium]